MLILGIDTSALAASAAVLKDGKLISECYINTGLTHSQTIMMLIDNCLKNANLSFSEIDAVAVAKGPGSFTGIRIGVSAVKGLCFAEDKPCMGVSTLEALAYCVNVEDCLICPVMDARCKQVYCALFEKDNGEISRILDDSAIALDDLYDILKKFVDKRIVFIGDGTDISYDYFFAKGLNVKKFSEIFKYQHASGVAIAAFNNYNKGEEFISSDKLLPSYLRLSQAERELNKTGG